MAPTQTGTYNAWTQVVGGGERYLLPLLPFGPTTQALAFRQAVALALMLNRTVLLTGIVEHPSTRRESNGSLHEPMFHHMEDLYNWWAHQFITAYNNPNCHARHNRHSRAAVRYWQMTTN